MTFYYYYDIAIPVTIGKLELTDGVNLIVMTLGATQQYFVQFNNFFQLFMMLFKSYSKM